MIDANPFHEKTCSECHEGYKLRPRVMDNNYNFSNPNSPISPISGYQSMSYSRSGSSIGYGTSSGFSNPNLGYETPKGFHGEYE